MSLDYDSWYNYRFGDLIDEIYKAHAYSRDELSHVEKISDTSIRYITRTSENNGCELLVDSSELEYIEQGNAITIGDTTATCFYQSKPFVTGDHMVIIRAGWLNELIGLYIVCLLNAEKYKYSYGRAYLIDRIKDTIIKLPHDESGNPDWHMMEKYITTLKHKYITTKNTSKSELDLNVKDWQEFRIPDLFNVFAGNYYYSDEYDEGNTPYVSASDTDNGIASRINLFPDFEGNTITIGKIGATAHYQRDAFCATSDVNILRPMFDMNERIGLFITNVINFSENYKWSYGRQCRVGDTMGIIIKLPIKYENGKAVIDKLKGFHDKGYIPDWEFMDKYIKALPYGDRI